MAVADGLGGVSAAEMCWKLLKEVTWICPISVPVLAISADCTMLQGKADYLLKLACFTAL